MPDEPAEKLEWNEENLSRVVSDLYKEAETDQALHDQLLADPFAVLNTRINVPDDYRGGVFSREKNKKATILYVPDYGVAREALPEGTREAEPPPDYEILCTVPTQW